MATETAEKTEAVYAITPPKGCPSYVTDSVQRHCNQALNQALSGEEVQSIEATKSLKMENELCQLRRAIDDDMCHMQKGSSNWWIFWGYRTITAAWSNAVQLAKFRDALANISLSHVTNSHPVNPNAYHVYVRDSNSPSGCHHICSAAHDLPGVDIVLNASKHSVSQGGLRGNR